MAQVDVAAFLEAQVFHQAAWHVDAASSAVNLSTPQCRTHGDRALDLEQEGEFGVGYDEMGKIRRRHDGFVARFHPYYLFVFIQGKSAKCDNHRSVTGILRRCFEIKTGIRRHWLGKVLGFRRAAKFGVFMKILGCYLRVLDEEGDLIRIIVGIILVETSGDNLGSYLLFQHVTRALLFVINLLF